MKEIPMSPRMNIFQTAPEAMKAMLEVAKAIEASGVDHGLLELVKLRASQTNACPFCLYMPSKDATKHGQRYLRINMSDASPYPPLFTHPETPVLCCP